MAEPDQLEVERVHTPQASGGGLLERAEPHRDVATDDDRTSTDDDRASTVVDDDHLGSAGVARRRDEADAGEQLELAVDGEVGQTRDVDPLADGVVVLGQGVLELAALEMDRRGREEQVAAAVVEVKVGVDDEVDAREVEVLGVQRVRARIQVGRERVPIRQAGVDEHAGVRVVDEIRVDGHPLAPDEQVGDQDGGDRDRSDGAHRASAPVVDGLCVGAAGQVLVVKGSPRWSLHHGPVGRADVFGPTRPPLGPNPEGVPANRRLPDDGRQDRCVAQCLQVSRPS